MRRDTTKLQLRTPAGRAQELGIVRQETLADTVLSLFPWDQIEEIKRGVRGADVMQSVCENVGPPAESILWESKRAAGWSKSWVTKLHSDRKQGAHSLGVIVSDVLPGQVGVAPVSSPVAADCYETSRLRWCSLPVGRRPTPQSDGRSPAAPGGFDANVIGRDRAAQDVPEVLEGQSSRR